MGIARRHLVSILLITAGACGGGSTSADASLEGDGAAAGPDAGPGPAGTVEVQTYSVCCRVPYDPPGELLDGVDIITHDVDGSVSVVTSENGIATIEVHAGATVTAVYRTETDAAFADAKLRTFIGVEPGDVLRFGEDWHPDLAPSATMLATFPSVDGARLYEVYGACGYNPAGPSETSADVEHFSYCAPATEDIYLFALDDAFEVIKYGVIEDAAFVDGAAVSLSSWQDVGTFALEVTGLAGEVGDVALGLEAIAGGNGIHGDLGGVGLLSGGAYTWTTPWPPVGDTLAASARVERTQGMQFVSELLEPGATAHTIADPFTLPWITSVSNGIADLRERTLRYTLDGDQPYDATVVYMTYGDMETAFTTDWIVYAPAGHSGENILELPDLPEAFEQMDPAQADAGAVFVELEDFTAAADYDAVRQRSPAELSRSQLVHGGRFSASGP